MCQTRKRVAIALVLAGVLGLNTASADSTAYDDVVDLEAVSGPVFALHHHDWATRVSYLQFGDALTRIPSMFIESPPLTYIWLSQGQRYFVGLSNIKIDNNTQLLVLDLQEGTSYATRISCDNREFEEDKICAESVTNFVYWYNADLPGIELEQTNGQPIAISVNTFLPYHCSDENPLPQPGLSCAQERVTFAVKLTRKGE